MNAVLDKTERLLLEFPGQLRDAGIDLQPLRTQDFLNAVRALPLRRIDDLYRAGRITLLSRPEDYALYNEIFDAWFCQGDHLSSEFGAEDEDKLLEEPPESDEFDPQTLHSNDAQGENASAQELLSGRQIAPPSENEIAKLQAFRKSLIKALPRVVSRRRKVAKRGSRIDLRRTMADACKHYGEPFKLHYTAQPTITRPILILIDVSGSMKDYTEAVLRLSHALVQTGERVEVFCFGTRLTRITKRLQQRDARAALLNLSDVVLDFDGGTRIGPSLLRLIKNSRFMSSIRGALTLVVSDGLERGDPAAMQKSVNHLSRLSHRLLWFSPLAADPAYQPLTRGMRAILPSLDSIEDGSSLAAFIDALKTLPELLARPRGHALRHFTKLKPLS